MRRFAVMIAVGLLALASACTPGKLLLPPDNADAAAAGGSSAGGSGGGSGGGASVGSGGSPNGSGGRSPGSGGFFGGGGALGSGGRSGSGGSGVPVMCGGEQRKLTQQIQRAKVVFALGRNASMAMPFGTGGGTRMAIAQEAIRTVVLQRQRAVNFGYEDFPAAAGACPNGTGCCINTTPLSPVFPSPSNSQLIDSALMSCDIASGMSGCAFQSTSRPIADALRNLFAPPQQRPPLLDPFSDGDQRLILMVDGGPVCSSEDAAASCSSALNQLSQLTDRVLIHVIPIDKDAEASECLRAIALQSGGGTTAQPFAYRGGDPAQLLQSLSTIVADAAKAACKITLREEPPDPNRVSVEIAGKQVPREQNGQIGWTFISGSRRLIEVHGAWCDEIQSRRDSDIVVWYCQ